MLAPSDFWRAWSAEPGTITFLAILAIVYARGVWSARRLSGGRAVSVRAIASFVTAWLALVVALVSPLDQLGETLFAAHMAQHLVLIVIAAPLFVLGVPPTTVLWALPRRQRIVAGRWWAASRRGRGVVAWLLTPVLAVAAHTLALWIWHFPRPYQAALEYPVLHALEHASFFGTAMMFWWVVLHPGGRRTLGFGSAILYIGITLCQSGALGALLMFSRQAWYPLYAPGERLWGLTPLEDQQLAGLIMWIPASAVYVAAAAALFMEWMRADERAIRVSDALRIAAVFVGIVSAGCTRSDPPAGYAIANSDPSRGRVAIERAGCGSCHDIPGIRAAAGMVGPPLTHWSQRRTIAGEMENTPEHLITWITMPQAVEPGSAMPNMGLSDGEARDIAAYLYSIK